MILPPMGTPGKCPAHCRNWKPEHDDFLVKNYSVMDIADIAAVLNRTASAVEGRSKYLRAKGFPVPYRSKNKPLTLKERQFIRDNRYTMTARQMAVRLNRHKVTITKTARKMGVSLRKLGDNNPCTRYKDEDVRLIRALRECTPPHNIPRNWQEVRHVKEHCRKAIPSSLHGRRSHRAGVPPAMTTYKNRLPQSALMGYIFPAPYKTGAGIGTPQLS
ncbi:hypothetical protein ACH8KY_005250, partial [Salmonella enterica subsp. enterica serovar Braenderup]